MWIMTTVGFFSAVKHRDKTDTVIVRARCRKHLEDLVEQFTCGEKILIEETPNADYGFRINLSRYRWADIMELLALDIDYDNFKSACGRNVELSDRYIEFLHEVWEQGRNLTPPKREVRA